MTIDDVDAALTARLGRPPDSLHVAYSIGRGVDLVLGEAVVQSIHRATSFRASLLLYRDESVERVRALMEDSRDDGLRIIMVDVGIPSLDRLPVTIEGRVP